MKYLIIQLHDSTVNKAHVSIFTGVFFTANRMRTEKIVIRPSIRRRKQMDHIGRKISCQSHIQSQKKMTNFESLKHNLKNLLVYLFYFVMGFINKHKPLQLNTL